MKHLILDDTPYLQRGWCLAEAQWSVMRSDPRRLVCLDSIEEHKDGGLAWILLGVAWCREASNVAPGTTKKKPWFSSFHLGGVGSLD